MKKFISYVPEPFRRGLYSVFLCLGIVQYLAYYEGLGVLVSEYTGRGGLVIMILLTYMFKLDILAASIGFVGECKSWHWPLWIALLLTTLFESLSLAINYGPGKQPVTFIQQMWPKKKKSK